MAREVEPPVEVALKAGEFEEIRQLAHRTFGLDLKPGKEQLVAARLGRLMRAGRFGAYRQLYRHTIEDRTGEALAAMIDALATNHTAFYREPEHFRFLADRAAAEWKGRGVVEVWCAACSTGEEVWTLACALDEVLSPGRVRIAATDISRKALAAAGRAVYAADRCAALPPAWLARYFAKDGAGGYRVRPEVRSQAAFSRLNLMDAFHWPRQFAAVFCRNAMIYFDAETQARTVAKLAASLEPGGFLFLGHAESVPERPADLEYVRPAVYRKTDKRGGAWNRSS
ncbi:MAG TPA: protein-glutamate O-methyltransferase CheR [Bryobacteraceae bacterium]|nr:protein-glutamate O-methyltransferase CheR [Bryobacteraceae bacterium]